MSEEIKIKITGDESGVLKSLDNVDKKVKQTESSAKNLGAALMGALASAGAATFFKSTIDQANKLEASINRVESAARAFGQSSAKAKQAAQDLASDGFLSLNQSASALSNLMATGLNVDQSKKFITAAKDISAFGNTVGDAAGSIESGIKGILTGSSELVENMSPAMKTLSMKFTEQKNSVGPAIATQNLYNGVLKLGTQFAGDAAKYLQTTAAAQQALTASTEKASAAIGKSLQPALVAVMSVLKGIIDGFTGWFTSLDSGTASILAVGGVIISVVIPAIFGFGKALAALGLTAASTWTAVLGPIAWIIAAVTALGAALYQLEARGKSNNIADKYLKEKQAAQGASEKLLELSKLTKLNADQEKELAAVKADLTKRAEAMGKAYNSQGKSVKDLLADQEKLKNQEREFAADKVRANLKKNEAGLAVAESMGGFTDFVSRARVGGFSKEQAVTTLTKNVAADKQAILDIYQPVTELTKKQEAAVLKTDAKVARFVEMQNQFKEIEKDRLFTIASLSKKLSAEDRARAIQDANDNATVLRNAQIGAARQIYAEFIEDKHDSEMVALELQKNAAVAANRELFNAKKIDQKELAKRQEEIDAAAARKRDAIRVQSFADTAAAANATASGFASMANARSGGGSISGFGSVASGISGFSDKLKPLGVIGQGIGAVGSIVSTLSGLFGKSDQERAREAQLQKNRDEEAKALLELQANYQKSMLALQEAAAKLPFENMSRQLRLVEIEAQKKRIGGGDLSGIEAQAQSDKLAILQQTLTGQGGKISEGSLNRGVGSTPQELIDFLSGAGAQGGRVDLLSSITQQAAGAAGMTGTNAINTLSALLGQANQQRGMVPDEILNEVISQITKSLGSAQYLRSLIDATASPLTRDFLNAIWEQSPIGGAFQLNGSDPFSAVNVGGVQGLASEFRTDVSTAESLLSVIEQSQLIQLDIAGNTKKTADNTSLQLEKQRENMFIDIAGGGGGLRGFGQFLANGAAVNTSALSLSSSTSSAIAATSALKSWDERNFQELEKIVAINKYQAAVLLQIAKNTESLSSSGSITTLVTMLNDINSRT